MRGPALCTGLLLLLGAPAEAGGLEERLASFNEHARFPLPELDESQLAELEAGELVRLRHRQQDADLPQRVVALQVMEAPKEVLWIAARDDCEEDVERFTHVLLGETQGRQHWYQYLSVPFPFADRHWVIDVWNNVELLEALGDGYWERPWILTEGGEERALEAVENGEVPGISPSQAQRAVYVPYNQGAWVAIDLPDGRALIGYHVTTVVGGAIPDGLVAEFTWRTFRRLYNGIVARVPTTPAHYDADHEPMMGGDGEPIPPFE